MNVDLVGPLDFYLAIPGVKVFFCSLTVESLCLVQPVASLNDTLHELYRWAALTNSLDAHSQLRLRCACTNSDDPLHLVLLCVCPPPSDLPTGSYIQEDLSRCSSLCDAGTDCCDLMASCKCGTHTGQYDCICEKGYYGKGLQHECTGRWDGCTPGSCCVSPAVAVLRLRHINLQFLPSAASLRLNPSHFEFCQLLLKSAPLWLLLMG